MINLNKGIKRYKLLIVSAFLIALAQLFFWLSFEGVKASVASPITSTNAMFTALLAFIFLKEEVNLKKAMGILLVLTGIIIISFS